MKRQGLPISKLLHNQFAFSIVRYLHWWVALACCYAVDWNVSFICIQETHVKKKKCVCKGQCPLIWVSTDPMPLKAAPREPVEARCCCGCYFAFLGILRGGGETATCRGASTDLRPENQESQPHRKQQDVGFHYWSLSIALWLGVNCFIQYVKQSKEIQSQSN